MTDIIRLDQVILAFDPDPSSLSADDRVTSNCIVACCSRVVAGAYACIGQDTLSTCVMDPIINDFVI